MKISKFVQLVKNTKQCLVIHTPTEVYLSAGESIYKASEFPNISGTAQIAAVLDIEPKKLKKIRITEEQSKSREDVNGFDLSAGTTAGELEISKLTTAAAVDGQLYTAFRCGDNELVFFDEQLLAPLADKIKSEEEYLNYAARTHKEGYRYIVVKDGFEVLAAIMPVKVLSPAYMDQLRMFYHMCEQQSRIEREPQEKGTEDNE